MRPVVHRNIIQGTDEWHAIRAGKWCASSAAVIMGGLETGGLADLIKDIAWERTIGKKDPSFKSSAMDRGHRMEPESRKWYEFIKGCTVEEVGFVEHATVPNVGWSPDGLCGSGAIEAKNPLHKAWMEVKRTGKVPSQYRWQVRWAMWVGQLEWLDFLAYHPLAGGLIVPCEVTESEKQQMEERVHLLEGKVQKWIEIITDRRDAA